MHVRSDDGSQDISAAQRRCRGWIGDESVRRRHCPVVMNQADCRRQGHGPPATAVDCGEGSMSLIVGARFEMARDTSRELLPATTRRPRPTPTSTSTANGPAPEAASRKTKRITARIGVQSGIVRGICAGEVETGGGSTAPASRRILGLPVAVGSEPMPTGHGRWLGPGAVMESQRCR